MKNVQNIKTKNTRDRRITETICCVIDCNQKPSWAVQSSNKERSVKCCDLHFPDLLRKSGLPAIVNEFVDKSNTETLVD